MASRLNEDLMGTNLDLTEGEIKIEGKVDPVYADAINVHNKKKKETEKIMNDKKKETEKAIKDATSKVMNVPKTAELKKLKLSESVFKSVREHYEDAPDTYQNIFRIVDNMEHIINYINELSDEEMTYEDMQQSYDVLEGELSDFSDCLFELRASERRKGTLKEDAAVLDRKGWELQDKRNNKDIWSDIYNELVGMKGIEAPHRRLKTNDRYKASWGDNPDESDAIRVGASRDGGIVVKADDITSLDFAKEVAETYGVEWRVKEHTSRYADSRYELIIYPFNSVSESLAECKAFGRKANKKDLKESANGEIYSKVVKYFEYGAPGETVDTVCDIVDRAISNIEEGYDIDEAVFDALDNGLIYHKDNWAIKHYYEDSELLDGTYESLYNDVYSIVSDLADNDDVDEGLTSAQRYNRKMDKIFNYKKETDNKMMDFLKSNSDLSDEEIKKAYDDDNLGGVLRDLGLHDKFWSKNESLKKARKLNESTFRGVPNTEFIWHGNWADPEVSTKLGRKTFVANYWEVEDSMWNYYNDEKEYANTKDDTYAQELKSTYTFDGSDEDFEKFLVNHADEVVGDIIELSTNK